jgi:hypothetical protein
VGSFDYANQPYVFSYRRFAERNPSRDRPSAAVLLDVAGRPAGA